MILPNIQKSVHISVYVSCGCYSLNTIMHEFQHAVDYCHKSSNVFNFSETSYHDALMLYMCMEIKAYSLADVNRANYTSEELYKKALYNKVRLSVISALYQLRQQGKFEEKTTEESMKQAFSELYDSCKRNYVF